MGRAADGTYTAPANSFNPAVEGTEIDEGDWNTLLEDMIAALSDSVSRSGKGTITGFTDYAENAAPGTPSADTMRLYAADVGGTSALMAKDPNGNVYNLLLSASGLAFTFDTSTTTASDPGSGKIRFNNATVASVTEIAVDDNDANGSDVSVYVLTWDDASGSARGTLILQKRTSPGTFAIFTVSGSSTDESGWTRLAVTHVTHSGSFSASDPLGVTFLAPGPAGATGSNGSAGANGTDPGVRWLFDSATTTNTDPGSGDLRLNNATLASVTEIALSYSSGETSNPSVETFVKAWDDSTSTLKGYLLIKKASAPQNFALYSISGTITDGTTYGRYTLTHVASNGTFSNTDVLSVQFMRTGDKGADGVGTGDVVGQASSVDSEIALFSGTGGKTIKRATTTGLLKASSGVLSAAASGTDYAPATSGSGVLKGNGSGGFSASTDGTDHLSSTTGLKQGKRTIPVVAAAMIPNTTNGPSRGTAEMSTNKNMLYTLDFDSTTQESAQFAVPMPKSYNNGTVTAQFGWSHASTTTNFGVAFDLAGVAVSDDDAQDVAFGTVQQVTDTGGTTNDLYWTAETSAITIAGTPAAGDMIMFRVRRVPADAADTMAIDARLHGIRLYYTENAATDA